MRCLARRPSSIPSRTGWDFFRERSSVSPNASSTPPTPYSAKPSNPAEVATALPASISLKSKPRGALPPLALPGTGPCGSLRNSGWLVLAPSLHYVAGVSYDAPVDALLQKVWDGQRINQAEALQLYHLPLEELGALADRRRELAKTTAYDGHGNQIVTYIVDRNINYTNVCNVYCKFCAFYRTEKDEDAYVLTLEQIDQKLDALTAIGGVQILLQGGHHPKLGIDWYINLLQHIREKYPHINIHGFSPPEFQHFAETFRMPLREVILEFKNAGLGSIPGGGGEILVDRVRKKISPLKINTDQWLEVMSVAHELGLNSSATMMFGHVETIEDRIEHLQRVREQQDRSGG